MMGFQFAAGFRQATFNSFLMETLQASSAPDVAARTLTKFRDINKTITEKTRHERFSLEWTRLPSSPPVASNNFSILRIDRSSHTSAIYLRFHHSSFRVGVFYFALFAIPGIIGRPGCVGEPTDRFFRVREKHTLAIQAHVTSLSPFRAFSLSLSRSLLRPRSVSRSRLQSNAASLPRPLSPFPGPLLHP